MQLWGTLFNLGMSLGYLPDNIIRPKQIIHPTFTGLDPGTYRAYVYMTILLQFVIHFIRHHALEVPYSRSCRPLGQIKDLVANGASDGSYSG